MPNPSKAYLAIAASLLAAGNAPALALDAGPNDVDDDGPIIVTATLEEEVGDFIDALTVPPTGGQLSRFEISVCPLAAGMEQSKKDEVVARMRAVATAANIRVADTACKPNVLVLITKDKTDFIKQFAKRFPGSIQEISGPAYRRLLATPGPAAAWHVNGPVITADGAELPKNVDGIYVNRTTRQPSRITAAARPQFDAAIVVIESDALVGLTTTQLADYAAMRTFIRTDPTKIQASSLPTILTVLDAAPDEDVPVTLTQWDLGVLRGFYDAGRNKTVAAQRSEIRKQVQDEIAEAQEPKN